MLTLGGNGEQKLTNIYVNWDSNYEHIVVTFLRLLGVQVMFLRSQGDGHCSYPLSCPNGYHLKCHNIPCSDAKEGTLCNVPRNWQVD